MIIDVLYVAIGGFFGAFARFFISRFVATHVSLRFPVATLLVNWLGSFLLGWMIGVEVTVSMNLLMGVGFFGSFTTFSTFTLELLNMAKQKRWLAFCSYFALSFAGGVVLAFAGFWLAGDDFFS